MLIYILKSSACLAIFFLFYKLFLEKENMHVFKRFYLLISLLVTFSIPFITFTSYVSVSPIQEFQTLNQDIVFETISNNTKTNYLPIILWSIYGLGALFFMTKFTFNLSKIIIKIRKNQTLKTKNFITVLLENLTTPHTFYKYIFLNKSKFEAKQIPQEVLLHEQAHACQKHSLDILFIELLQLVFWFNPLIYSMKHAIKLNHEFLADEAVLNKGVKRSTYQKILLNYSTYQHQPQLVNAINYSFIKKRFTIMKTHTSKKTIRLRSMLLLPLLTVLIYGFSEKIIVEKLTPQIQEQKKDTFIEPTRDNIKITLEDINKLKLNYSTRATSEQITEYNKLAKHYNAMSKDNFIVKRKEQERIRYIYDLMTLKQRRKAEPYPNFPPPPPLVTKSPKIIQGKLLPPTPLPANATSEQKAKYNEAMVRRKINEDSIIIGHKIDNSPQTFNRLDYIIQLAKRGATFNYESKKISSDKAIALVKKNSNISMLVKDHNSNNPIVELSDKPVSIILNQQNSIDYPYKPTKLETDGKTTEWKVHLGTNPLDSVIEEKKLSNWKVGVGTNPAGPTIVEGPVILEEPINVKGGKLVKGRPTSYKNYIKEMAKKGATFYYEGKKTSLKKVLKIEKEHGIFYMLTQDADTENPLVILSRKEITKKDSDKIAN